MNKVDQYLQAGTRANTRKSYRAAVEHFEVKWGGFLPATGSSIVRYLADCAEQHAFSTLKQRLAALAQWHITQGFPDPTKTPEVRQVLKGIRALHPIQQKQASPLLIQHLEKVVLWLRRSAEQASQNGDRASVLRCRRDIALVLIGFWRGFRGDELARLQVEATHAKAGVGISFFLTQTKTDRLYSGATFKTPALKSLCPVDAYIEWITSASLVRGPVFRKLDRWGNLSDESINPNSLIPMLRKICAQAGVPAEAYSGHSMRRGFATWAAASGWDIKSLMTYVGWKDMKSALRYVDASVSFDGLARVANSSDVELPSKDA